MERLLDKKTAVITGANRGIGRAVAEAFAMQGADIFACARKKSSGFEEDMHRLEEKYHVTVFPVYFDLCNADEIKSAVKQMREKKRPIDILVNNAGILSEYQSFTMMPMEKVRRLFDVDFFAQMEFTQYIARLMQRNRSGSIVYLSSIASIDAFFSSYDYAACKAAINTAMKQQARELGKSGIRVNAVAPGIVQTDMIKDSDKDNLNSILPAVMLQRFGRTEEIANAVMFLASDLASYITGQVLRVDGGTNPPRADW